MARADGIRRDALTPRHTPRLFFRRPGSFTPGKEEAMTRAHTILQRLVAACIGISLAVTPGTTTAGQVLICNTYDIGAEASLPWGDGPRSPRSDYARERLVADTLALLTPELSVLGRMETIRRATIYAESQPSSARELLGRLMARVLETEAGQRPSALAWFDAGYFAATLRQTNRLSSATAEPVDGYRWVTKAIDIGSGDPAMHFAAALIRHESPSRPGVHLAKAYADVKAGSTLARNLDAHFGAHHRVRSAGAVSR
jgi:hypothetical protein